MHQEEAKVKLGIEAFKSAPMAMNEKQVKSAMKTCIRVTDNGPGISPYRMRQSLTQFGMEPTRANKNGPFDFGEHGIGFKIACLRLGQTCLLLSKTSTQA